MLNAAERAFLGERAAEIVEAVSDPRSKELCVGAIRACHVALQVVNALDLSEHELADPGTPDLSTWDALATPTRNVLMATRTAADRLLELFAAGEPTSESPSAEDIDAAFDAMEAGTDLSPIRDKRGVEIEDIVSDEEDVSRAIGALASMLQSDFISFGQRLRNPRLVSDRWALLGELHEFRSKCARCLEAVVATVIRWISSEDPEEILPSYHGATMQAVLLRREAVDLRLEVLAHQDTLRGEDTGPDPVAEVRARLNATLDDLASRTVYDFLRPIDKRQIILFRIFLGAEETSRAEMRRQLEGFAKFLEVMGEINQRQELVKHDARQLDLAAHALIERRTADAVRQLALVYGRHPALDEMIRRLRAGADIDPDEALQRLVETRAVLPLEM